MKESNRIDRINILVKSLRARVAFLEKEIDFLRNKNKTLSELLSEDLADCKSLQEDLESFMVD